MENLNRSDRSDVFQDRELIEAVLQKADEVRTLNESGGSRLSSLVLQHPSLRSASNLSRPASIVSKQSVTWSQSQEKLSDVGQDFLEKSDHIQYEHVKINILVLALLSMSSIILGCVAMQLIVAMGTQQTTSMPQSGLVVVNVTQMMVMEVATALATFVVTLDMTCLLVCSLQCLIVVKLLKVHLGDER